MNKRYGFEHHPSCKIHVSDEALASGKLNADEQAKVSNIDEALKFNLSVHRNNHECSAAVNADNATVEEQKQKCLETYECADSSPIRAIAEYEPMGGVVIAYVGTVPPSKDHTQLAPTGPRTFGIPNELIIRMQQLGVRGVEPVHIFVLCNDPGEKKNIIESLTATAKEKNLLFDPNLIHLIPWDADTYWTRDYAPWWVMYENVGDGNEKFAISKHIYTTLGGGSVGMVEGAEGVNPRIGSGIFRCNDDYGSVKISDFLNAPIRSWNGAKWDSDKVSLPQIPTHDWFFSGLLNVGGNYMVTSKNVISSSYLVATQNELPTDSDPEKPSWDDLDSRMKYIMQQTNRFLGAKKYHVVVDPTGTYIGHIDCWGKFLSDDTILIASVADKEINRAFDEIADAFAKNGFKVPRVYAPNVYLPEQGEDTVTTAPYTNSLILNKCVYVPILDGANYEDYNKAAIKAYEDAMPGYTVIGIYGKPETPWYGTDALHCRTNAIPRKVINNWLRSLDTNAAAKELLKK